MVFELARQTGQPHKFMANLMETVFDVMGKTILYIPAEHITVRVGVCMHAYVGVSIHTVEMVFEIKSKTILYIRTIPLAAEFLL